MGIIHIVLVWAAERFIPMDGTVKQIMIGVVVIAIILWLVSIFSPWMGVRM